MTRDPLAPPLVECAYCASERRDAIACPGPLESTGCEGPSCGTCDGDEHVPAWLADPQVVGEDTADVGVARMSRAALAACWARMWPTLLAVVVVAVGAPAAVASYRHARDVVPRSVTR